MNTDGPVSGVLQASKFSRARAVCWSREGGNSKNQARDVLLFDFAPNEFKSTGRGRFQANPLCEKPCTVRVLLCILPGPPGCAVDGKQNARYQRSNMWRRIRAEIFLVDDEAREIRGNHASWPSSIQHQTRNKKRAPAKPLVKLTGTSHQKTKYAREKPRGECAGREHSLDSKT